MKKAFFIILMSVFALPVFARHVAGGELYYEYLGSGSTPGTSNYRITLRLFRDCGSPGPFLEVEQVNVGIYENNIRYTFQPLLREGAVTQIRLNTEAFPCLVGDVIVCYETASYSAVVSLPDNVSGYTLSRVGCCRVDNISNLSQRLSVGSNYVTKIPGTATLPEGHNSSPKFLVKDTALVCANKNFMLDFGAEDADGDSLTFALCDAYIANSATNNAIPPQNLNLIPLPYRLPFSGDFPLGSGVTINPNTGVISGIAPPEGGYVVNVCVTEWRNGKPFSEHRKDFILEVKNCDFIEARLPEKIVQCDTNVVRFENGSSSSQIISYLWDFGDPSSNTNSSTNSTPTHTYADTGRYRVYLNVTGPKGCLGTDSTIVLVYPGFTPAFNVSGNCFINPYVFRDATTAKYGVVNAWRWDFGVEASIADTSILQNPTYQYTDIGNRTTRLIVSSSKGCIDTLQKSFVVRDRPSIPLPFKDTLICSIDSLRIPVPATGTFSWLPNRNILFGNTSSPLVFPKDTIRYVVTLTENGCTGSDTVTINVLDFITVQIRPDTTICETDSFRFNPVSDALQYQWSPAFGLDDPGVKQPTATPLVNTLYTITANLGKCQASAQVAVKVAPYPQVNIAGNDTTLCFGERLPLRGSYRGTDFRWSPAAFLSNARTLNPIAGPGRTTRYILTATDTLSGCPKSMSDTLTITIIPPIIVHAGRDTSVVPNQVLQLNATATGVNNFRWTPPLGLSNPAISNPSVQLGTDIDSMRYSVRAFDGSGCYAEDDLLVRVFKTAPEIFVPTAFTPNGDGRNDELKPLTVGISQLTYFRIYNRWGQLLFSSSVLGQGWDGTYKGIGQPSNTYVFATEGKDYTGKTVFRKGTTVLIR